jgi:hypothetical protein
VFATRDPKAVNLADLADLIHYGASPRASIYLALAPKPRPLSKAAGMSLRKIFAPSFGMF